MQKIKRRQLLIDGQVQGPLLLRTALYWACSVFAVSLLLFIWRTVAMASGQVQSDGSALSRYTGPVILTTVLLLPAFAYDFLKLSNQLVGPVSRLRRAIRQAAAGQRVEPLKFRKGDFWEEFAEEVNSLLRRMQELESTATSVSSDEVTNSTGT